jgi:hypothetical protein
MSENPNPLEEAMPDSLDELFSRDPLKLGETDLRRIVEELRRMRKNFLITEAEGKKPKRAPKAAPIDKSKLANLDLGDLGL